MVGYELKVCENWDVNDYDERPGQGVNMWSISLQRGRCRAVIRSWTRVHSQTYILSTWYLDHIKKSPPSRTEAYGPDPTHKVKEKQFLTFESAIEQKHAASSLFLG